MLVPVRDLTGLPNLTPRNVLHILRVLQEALTNAVKHAGATLITVSSEVDHVKNVASIRVIDDGRGFQSVETSRSGRGLGNMRRRAEAVGGSIVIDSGEEGSTITLVLPLSPRESG